VQHTSFWLHRIQLPWQRLTTFCGTSRFRWRYLSLRGVSCVIGYQRRQTWFPGELSHQISTFTSLGVVVSNRHNTCFSHAVLLVFFGV
jgi:hypothetical protein